MFKKLIALIIFALFLGGLGIAIIIIKNQPMVVDGVNVSDKFIVSQGFEKRVYKIDSYTQLNTYEDYYKGLVQNVLTQEEYDLEVQQLSLDAENYYNEMSKKINYDKYDYIVVKDIGKYIKVIEAKKYTNLIVYDLTFIDTYYLVGETLKTKKFITLE